MTCHYLIILSGAVANSCCDVTEHSSRYNYSASVQNRTKAVSRHESRF